MQRLVVSVHPASYRDPSGFVFFHDQTLYRQVDECYKEDYETLIHSGLYTHLTNNLSLIPHQEIDQNFTGLNNWYKTLQPEAVPFITYPYEWSFDMLKDAALLTLQIAQEAMNYGMMLKDATPYNVQMHNSRMTFIDTLSFERYDATKPWIAYRQFCENFLAPLALMHFKKRLLQPLLVSYPEGIPIAIAQALLPFRSKWNLNTYLHLHLNSSVSAKAKFNVKQPVFSAQKLKNILKSLEQAVQSYRLSSISGVWSNYYEEATQRAGYISHKKEIINDWLNALPMIKTAIDAGANEGMFAELLASKKIFTIAADSDHFSVNNLYNKTKQKTNYILPLLMDFSNPSPAIGINNEERQSFLSRSHTDIALALAFIHHLAIGKNIPFDKLVQLFRSLGKILIIEFVPKEDEKVQLMLQQKKDIYDWYTEENFLSVFADYYKIIASKKINNSGRTLYLMHPHEN